MIELVEIIDRSFNTGVINILKNLKENINITRRYI